MNQLKQAIGFDPETSSPAEDDSKLVEFVNLKLAARGFPTFGDPDDFPFLKLKLLFMMLNCMTYLWIFA